MTVSRKSWNPPGWPWELEFIVFCTMLLSVFFPTLLSYLGINGTPSLIGQTPGNGNPIAEQHQIVFSFGLISLYLVHLVMAVTTFSHLTTPITHMLSPLIFSAAAYQRTSAHVLAHNMDVPWFNGSTAHLILVLLAVFLVCIVAARIRMARYLLKFRDQTWDLQSPTVFDSSFWEMITQWRPLLYTPRNYRACPSGLLIEGWYYIMPVPFDVFHAVSKVSNVSMSTNGSYYATTSRSLIRIELLDSTIPMFISPRDRDAIVDYCEKHIERRKASRGSSPRGTRAGTAHGTRPGMHTASGTASGSTD